MSSSLLPALFASLLTCAACAPSSGEPPPATPDATTLCKIVFGVSRVNDALALLGTPTTNETFADGSGFLAYQYQDSPDVVAVELEFDAAQVVTGAITLNFPRPPCWPAPSGDGGLPESGDFVVDASAPSVLTPSDGG